MIAFLVSASFLVLLQLTLSQITQGYLGGGGRGGGRKGEKSEIHINEQCQ